MENQATISSLAERLGGSRRDRLRDSNKEHRLSKADIGGPISKSDKSIEIVDTPESLGAPSMVVRCVIIHRDEKGYGLTVSGDNPVYVQSVKENGAAQGAGVQQGDRIIKVNGTNVTEYNHIEVVKLIKSGPYVALTLLGPPLSHSESKMAFNSTASSLTSSSHVSRASSKLPKDTSFYNEKVNTITKMLDQELAEVERIKEDYAKDPNKKLLEDLGVAQKLLQDLEKQLWKAKSSKQSGDQDIPIAQIQELADSKMSGIDFHGTPGISRTGNTDVGERKIEQTDIDLIPPIVQEESDLLMDISNTRGANTNLTQTDPIFGLHDKEIVAEPMQPQRSIINFEDDDDLTEDSDAFQDHGPFRNFDELRTKPAHMAVFIIYVFRSHDPSCLLLVLMVDNFRLLTSTKEMNKLADLICKTYLQKNGPLGIAMDEGIAKSIIDAVHSKNISEDAIKAVFDPAVQQALPEVQAQLQQFCNKREQGLSNCFGEDKILPGMDHSQEIKVVEEVLTPLIQDLGSSSDETEMVKANAKIDALEKFIVQWTGKRKSKLTSKLGSMLRTSKPTGISMRPKTASSMESIIEDQNKRMSKLVKWPGKKPKRESSASVSTVTPTLMVPSNETGLVAKMVKQLQDGPEGTQSNLLEVNETGNSEDLKTLINMSRSGSFRSERRQRSATGKSNSDPDVNTVELAVSQRSGSLEGNLEQSHLSSSTSATSMVSSVGSNISGSLTSNSLISNEDLMSQLISKYPELEVEPETQWSVTTPREIAKTLDKKECKRQEIINELLHTEKHHVRDLSILNILFYQSLQDEDMLNLEELYLVFPNLQKILEMHRQLKIKLEELKENDGHVIKDIAHVLLETFDGAAGNSFKEECAKYCGNQTAALEFIKDRCKKDQKFNNFIQTAEKHPICRRLQLKDFVPIEFQRLTKYPLLLENIIKNTRNKEEANKLRHMQKQCKDILKYVNKAVKDAEDHQKIIEIQKNLDASSLQKVNHPIVKEYKNMNLVERTLVHQGPLIWRITQTEKKKSVVLHCVLFEDIMVLLQKQDDRYVLKCHTSTAPNSTKDEKSTVQPPILKLSKVLVRNVATDKKAFFVVSMSEFGPQIYELVASTTHEMQEWLKIVSTTAENAKKRDSSAAHIRRDAFMIAESSRSSTKSTTSLVLGKTGEISEPTDLETPDIRDETEDGNRSIVKEIQKKSQEISTALEVKHNLLATYAGIEVSELENILDMSLVDTEADSKTLVLQSLTSAKKLTSILNDLLQPDTVFLQPPTQPVLQPISSETTTQKSSMVYDSVSSQYSLHNVPEIEDSKLDTNSQPTSHASEDTNKHFEKLDPSLEKQTVVNEETFEGRAPDRFSNASLELVNSDYETASETNSPIACPSLEKLNLSKKEVEPTVPVADEDEEEIDSTTIDKEPNSTATDDLTDATGDIDFKDLPFNAENTFGDLLGFGPTLSPDLPVDSLSPTLHNTNVLMANTSPVRITRMIEITHSLESQLSRLLQCIRDETEEKQSMFKQNAELLARISQLDANQNSNSNTESSLTSEISVQEKNAQDSGLSFHADAVPGR